MKKSVDIKDIYKRYIDLYGHEKEALNQFGNFILMFDDEQLFNRKNFAGHITASAMIVSTSDFEILLIEHKYLKRWLQPGGHVEKEDVSILDAAIREVQEETGIASDKLQLIASLPHDNVPFDIDSHKIPENARKGEPAHYHHDFRYLFAYAGDKSLLVKGEDGCNLKWASFDNAEQNLGFKQSVSKIRPLLANQPR